MLLALSSLLILVEGTLVAAPPASPKKPVVDEYQGVKVTDDFRWLEKADDPAVKQWSDAQTAYARAQLDAIPFHDAVQARVDKLIRSTSERWSSVIRRGDLTFAVKFEPTKQQPFLVSYKSLDDKKSERVLVDPNAIDPTGKTAIDFWEVSNDGKLLAASLSKNGSEAGDLHVFDVATAKEVGEVIPHVNNGTAGGSVAFAPDNSGFWYTRYPRGTERPPEDAGFFQQVYFHKFGTKTETDTYELGKELPRIAEIELFSRRDGKWILAHVRNGDGGEVALYVRPTAAEGKWSQVSTSPIARSPLSSVPTTRCMSSRARAHRAAGCCASRSPRRPSTRRPSSFRSPKARFSRSSPPRRSSTCSTSSADRRRCGPSR
jgi:prolyl oligopeptidase